VGIQGTRRACAVTTIFSSSAAKSFNDVDTAEDNARRRVSPGAALEMELPVPAIDIQTFRTGVFSTSGWGRAEYSGWIDESQSWKTSCYVGDWSFLDELHVRGPDALKLFSDFCVNSFARFALGQAKHVICCNSGGHVIGEGVLMRHAEDEFEFQALGPVTAWLEYSGFRLEPFAFKFKDGRGQSFEWPTCYAYERIKRHGGITTDEYLRLRKLSREKKPTSWPTRGRARRAARRPAEAGRSTAA
jgi:hypothetical protein